MINVIKSELVSFQESKPKKSFLDWILRRKKEKIYSLLYAVYLKELSVFNLNDIVIDDNGNNWLVINTERYRVFLRNINNVHPNVGVGSVILLVGNSFTECWDL